jgi:hypothetical protein
MEFDCQYCNKMYKSRVGLWKHNKVCVSKVEEKKYVCSFCDKSLSSRQSRWVHQKTCQEKKNQMASESETVVELKNKIKILESKSTIQNNIINDNKVINNDNKVINNYTQNIVISSSPGFETIDHLTTEQKKFIMNKGLSSLMYLIETTNFDKSKPENHSYCVTALNDKHASIVDTKTNSIIKTDKNELYDKVLAGNLNKLEKLSADTEFETNEKTQYIETVERLKKILFLNKKGIKKYYSEINLLSYNNKDLIQETWNGLKKLDEIILKNNFGKNTSQTLESDKNIESSSDTESDEEINTEKLINFQKKYLQVNSIKKTIINILNSTSDSELSSDFESDEDEQEVSEIVIKGVNYIVENNVAYCKTKLGKKGEVYGTYINNKLIKQKTKESVNNYVST